MPRLLRRDIHDACFSFRTFLEISYNCVETVVRCSLVDVRCCGSLTHTRLAACTRRIVENIVGQLHRRVASMKLALSYFTLLECKTV